MAAEPSIDKLKSHPFLDGPVEFMVKEAAQLISQVKQFKLLFRDSIDIYERMDYPDRMFPALRMYCHQVRKEHESHYIVGDMLMDILWPQSLRRDEQQLFQDMVSAALLQQFRRPSFFKAMLAAVPGLNEFGKVFSIDKALGMQWKDGIVPLTQITLNFRLDLKAWDEYLEGKGRTKDDPFQVTLENLERIVNVIQGNNDDSSKAVEVDLDQNISGG